MATTSTTQLLLQQALQLIADAEVSQVVRETVSSALAVAESAERRQLQQQLQHESEQARSELQQSETAWSQESAQLDAQIQSPQAQLARKDAAVLKAQNALELASDTVQTLKAEEKAHVVRVKSQSEQRDLTLLPKLVLKQVVSFLTREDLSTALLVCHRWKFTLARGYVWKAVTVSGITQLKKSVAKVQKETERARYYASLAPRTVHMDLTGIRDIAQQLEPHEKRLEGPVAKQKMFSLATKQVQLKIEHAKSEWEDASSRNAADREVRKFLKDRLRKNVNALGSAQLEKVRLNTATRKMTFLKKQVHDSANMQDSQLKSEEDYRAAALNEKQRELSALTMRIDLLKNTRKHQTQTQAQSDAAGQEKVSKLKKDIKLLVKVVKRLEADRTTVLKSARQYETKLARLKEQVNVTGEF